MRLFPLLFLLLTACQQEEPAPRTEIPMTRVCDGRLLFSSRDVLLTDARVRASGTGLIRIRNRTDDFMDDFEICHAGRCSTYERELTPRGEVEIVLYNLPQGEERVGSHLFTVTPQNRECRYERQ